MLIVMIDLEEELGIVVSSREQESESTGKSLDPATRATTQYNIVAQRQELQTALTRVLRERWRQKASAGLVAEDARTPAQWLETFSENGLRTVGEETSGDRP